MLKIKWTPDLARVRVDKRPDVLKDWYALVARSAHERFDAEHKKPGRGRVYQRRGRHHRASAPGDYPAVDSGRLLAGTRDGANGQEGFLGTNVFYARFLLGTQKMAPRKLYYEAMSGAAKANNGSGLEGYLRWTA